MKPALLAAALLLSTLAVAALPADATYAAACAPTLDGHRDCTAWMGTPTPMPPPLQASCYVADMTAAAVGVCTE